MKFLTLLTAALVVLVCATSGWALTDKEQSIFNRAQKSVQSVEEKIEKRKASGKAFNQSVNESNQKKLTKAEELLSELPSEPQVEQLRQTIATLKAQLAEGAQTAEANASEAASLLESPDYERDREQMVALEEFYASLKGLDAKNPIFGRDSMRSRVSDLEGKLESLPQANAQLEQLTQKWQPVLSVNEGKARFIALPLKNATRAREKFTNLAEKFEAESKGRIQSLMGSVQSNLSAVKSYDQFEKQVSQPMQAVADLASLLSKLGKLDAGLQTQITALETSVAAKEKAAAEALISSNTGPGNGYSGADRGAIEQAVKNAWNGRYPGEQILAVQIPHNWSRDTGWKWDTTSKAWQKYDSSSMMVYAFQAHSATVVKWSQHRIYKYHLRGDALGVHPFKKEEPTPRRQMLRSKL